MSKVIERAVGFLQKSEQGNINKYWFLFWKYTNPITYIGWIITLIGFLILYIIGVIIIFFELFRK